MNFPYSIKKHKKAKRIKITIEPDATIKVTIPYRLPKLFGHKFVKQNLKWIQQKLAEIQQNPKHYLKGSHQEYILLKEKARELITSRLIFFNKHYNFKYNAIRIKNTKRTWGSCSRKTNLNFNYKISLITPQQCDYIVVHELCHLKEFNHSQRFWNLVSQTIPDYKKIRASLRSFRLQ